MKNIRKILTNKLVILLILIISAYSYAAVYESAAITPIDELGQMMTDVTNEESFIEAYSGNEWDMTLEQYKATLGNIGLLKSRFLQGPISFLTSLLVFLIAMLVNHIAVRINEKVVRYPCKTPIIDTIDTCFPVLLAEAAKYIICAIYASSTGVLIDYSIVFSTVLAIICSIIPYVLNFIVRKRSGKPVAAIPVACLLATAANLAFHLI